MRQFRAFGHTGRSAGVLQECRCIAADFDFVKRLPLAFADRLAHRYRAGNLPGRHHFFHILDDQVHQLAFRRRQHVADSRRHDRAHIGMFDHLFEHMCKILENDDRLCARILQLVLQFARRIQRIDIHHGEAGAQYRHQRDRVLQQVRHHDGNTIAALQTRDFLQPCGKIAALLIHIGIGQRRAHVVKCRQILVTLETGVQHIVQGAVSADIDRFGCIRRIVFQPDFFCHNPPRYCSFECQYGAQARWLRCIRYSTAFDRVARKFGV